MVSIGHFPIAEIRVPLKKKNCGFQGSSRETNKMNLENIPAAEIKKYFLNDRDMFKRTLRTT